MAAMPAAFSEYMVSIRSRTSWRMFASTSFTSKVGSRSRGSGYVTMSRTAMAKVCGCSAPTIEGSSDGGKAPCYVPQRT